MTAHNHGAIVQRRFGIEYTDQQIVTEFGVELHAAINDVLQPYIALDYDQCARLSGRQGRGGEDNFIVSTFAKLSQMPLREGHAKTIAKRNQCLADFRLEKHDDGDADVKQATAQHKFQGCEVFLDGEPVEEGESANGGGHRGGASPTNEFQNCIHKQEDKHDVRDVARLTKSSQILRVWQ